MNDTDDLVERLRIHADDMSFPNCVEAHEMREAADEIERLRSQRNEVVEECARVAETAYSFPQIDHRRNPIAIAAAIRNLKTQEERGS